MIRLTFYTRPECHLCDAAKFVLRKVQCTHPFELVEVDISAPGNDAVLEAYGNDIPVICCDDVEWFRHRVVESALRRRLESASPSAPGA